MFSFVSRGNRANSAAIQPKLRTILRVASLRCASVHSGKASRRLNSAVFRSLGTNTNRTAVTVAAKLRATARGSAPIVFKIIQTAAYSSHSLIVFGGSHSVADARQYARGEQFEDRGSMLDFPFRERIANFHPRKTVARDCGPHRLGHSHCRYPLRF